MHLIILWIHIEHEQFNLAFLQNHWYPCLKTSKRFKTGNPYCTWLHICSTCRDQKGHIHERKTRLSFATAKACSIYSFCHRCFCKTRLSNSSINNVTYIFPNTTQLGQKSPSQTLYHRFTEWSGLEAILKYHLVPTPLPLGGTSSTRLGCSSLCMCYLYYIPLDVEAVTLS